MITIGSVALVSIIAYIVMRYKSIKEIYIRLFSVTAIIELIVERGYFLQIGGQQLTYAFFCEIVLAFISIILLLRGITIPNYLLTSFLIIVIVLIIGWLNLMLFPSNAMGANFAVSWDAILVDHAGLQLIRLIPDMWQVSVHVLLYLIISLVSLSIFSKQEWLEIVYNTISIIRYFIIYGVFEAFITYCLKNNFLNDIINLLLGVSRSTVVEIIDRGNGYSLSGLTKEPSHYVFSLAITIILLCAYLKLQYKNSASMREILFTKFCIFFSIVLMGMSMAFSTIYFGICLVLYYFLVISKRGGNNYGRIGIFSLIILLIFKSIEKITSNIMNNVAINTFWGRRIVSLIQEWNLVTSGSWLYSTNSLEWSNRVRLGSTYETFKLIKYRPFFGLGWGATTAHSALAMLISSCGIIGSLLYVNYFSIARKVRVVLYNKLLFYTSLIIYLVMNIFNSLSLRPFYECWTIILIFAFEILSEKRKK